MSFVKTIELWFIIRNLRLLKTQGHSRERATRRSSDILDMRLRGWLADGTLAGVDLSNCNITGCSLDGANFEGANLQGSCFAGSSFRNATLKGADLLGANFHHAVFDERTILPDGSRWTASVDMTRFTEEAKTEPV